MATYIKLFTDYDDTFGEMSDAEAGRLIKALLHYGASGEMRTLSGGERLVFGIIRRQIDRDNDSANAHREAGRNGGRPRTNENQTEPNETKPNQTEPKTAMTKEEDNKTIDNKTTDKDEDNKTKRGRFTPPTREQVAAYIAEHGYRVDTDRWMAYYESNGWRVGKNPMRDWKAAVRTWASNGYDTPKKTPQTDYEQREYEERKPGQIPQFILDMEADGAG
jgi:hypothetical protein